MHLLALETASPESRYTQTDCHSIFSASQARTRLKARSVELMEKVLLRNNGIATRGFCYPDVETIFDAGPEQLNRVFEEHAPRLGTRALRTALASARLDAAELDGLVVCTCTGYLCPGLSSFIAEQAGLREDCELTDLVGMGCGAAIPALRLVSHQVRAEPRRRIAMVAVEVCSAAFYLDDNPGVIISACLFGDGAAASVWTGEATGDHWRADLFESLHLPEKRQLLRFENAGGALRNRLSRRVPEEAARAVRDLHARSVAAGLDPHRSTILPHTGGRDVLDALEAAFPGLAFPASREVLRLHGNMSSPSILFVLKAHLESPSSGGTAPLWLTSFGAGFTAYACRLQRTQAGQEESGVGQPGSCGTRQDVP